MARHTFGGDAASMVVAVAGNKTLSAANGVAVTFATASSAGSAVTDLLAADGVTPITSVTTNADGTIPLFYGPDGTTQLWAIATGVAERLLVSHNDLAATYAPASVATANTANTSAIAANTSAITALQGSMTTNTANINKLMNASPAATVNLQTASYTGALTDQGGFVQITSASACTYTQPPNATVPYPLGTQITVSQGGAGLLTLTPGAGVTFTWNDANGSGSGGHALAGQYAQGTLTKIGTDAWRLSGAGLAAATAPTDTTAPTAASSLHTTSVSGTSVALAWTASTDAVGVTKYEVFRDDSTDAAGAGLNWALVGTVTGAPPATSFTDTSVPNGTWTYAIRAYDAAGNQSAASNGVNATISAGSYGTPAVPFTAVSYWNAAIPGTVNLDTNNSALVSALSGGSHVCDIYEFGVPIWEADANTPHFTTTLTTYGGTSMDGASVPYPSGCHGSSGSDGAMVVVDHSNNKSYEFWQVNVAAHTAGGGGICDITGTGSPGDTATSGAGPIGAGSSRLAGVIRVAELVAGVIPHALVFSSNQISGSFRAPAIKSGGGSGSLTCGARVQLNPAYDISALATFPKMIAQALKTYGAYCIDGGGATMAIVFEGPSGETDWYAANGISDYYGLSTISWSQLRVLRTWNGA